jgi:hypothetical protein
LNTSAACTGAVPDDVLVQRGIAGQHDAAPVPVDAVAEGRIAVGMLDRECGDLDAVPLERDTVVDDVRLDGERLDRIELVDAGLEVVADHRAHALHHLLRPLGSPQLEAVVAAEQEPRRHPQIGQSFEVIVVQMGEEDAGDVLRIDAALVEALIGPAPHVEQQELAVRLDQRRDPESVREIFRPGCSKQRHLHLRVLHLGVLGPCRAGEHERGQEHRRGHEGGCNKERNIARDTARDNGGNPSEHQCPPQAESRPVAADRAMAKLALFIHPK